MEVLRDRLVVAVGVDVREEQVEQGLCSLPGCLGEVGERGAWRQCRVVVPGRIIVVVPQRQLGLQQGALVGCPGLRWCRGEGGCCVEQ